MRGAILFCIFLVPLHQALAVEPSEILSDPALEARAREISSNLRCLVCQNESIDDSAAPLARDLRVLVRELVVEGKSDREVYNYIESRYGEFALFQPRFQGTNLILYGSGPILLVVGFATALMYIRRRRKNLSSEPDALSGEERQILRRLLDSDQRP